jgi:hypothetical protein
MSSFKPQKMLKIFLLSKHSRQLTELRRRPSRQKYKRDSTHKLQSLLQTEPQLKRQDSLPKHLVMQLLRSKPQQTPDKNRLMMLTQPH